MHSGYFRESGVGKAQTDKLFRRGHSLRDGGKSCVFILFTYDGWGNVLTTGGYDADFASRNPLRYRGYYYDSETGLYYLRSRYYDPELGRFICADGYATTGQGVLGSNMFAYCGDNPVNRIDSAGMFWAGIWEFVETATAEIGKAMGNLAPAYAGCAGTAVVDGPLPFGDVLAVTGAVLLTVGAIGYGISQAAQAPGFSLSKGEEKVKVADISSQTKKRAFFTLNPYDFAPNGLVMKEYSGSKNGRIIEWRDPHSQVKIFEWDEDLKNGSHYHAMMIEWDGKHDGTHYLPGTPVPEPWNSIYFGG